jgi:isoamylase
LPRSEPLRVKAGNPYPLGATWDGEGTNFSLFSADATSVDLLLFDDPTGSPAERIRLTEKSGQVWHGYLPEVGPGKIYAYCVDGPYDPIRGHRFNRNKALLDPYAKAVAGRVRWDDALFGYTVGDQANDLSFDGRDSAPFAPKGLVVDQSFDWQGDRPPSISWDNTVIYELHVKGFTKLRSDMDERVRGTYAGLASPNVVGYLRDLGVTAVELLPVHQHVDNRFLVERGLSNYWGYNTIGFFAPDSGYSSEGFLGQQVHEFKLMVRALHQAGIEVILDVVYNHTAEGNQLGPTLSFRGIDNRAYYRLPRKSLRTYFDVTGTGNTLNMQNPYVIQMIMDSLRYWITEMHVDGFRFDLAPALAREHYEFDRFATFFEVIHQDPVVSRAKLIAEPWDLGPRGYQLGGFPPIWAEWNDKFRDGARRYWKGGLTSPGEVATRLAGSSDIFSASARGPLASINFVTCHDGFTLNDVLSYQTKHNEANGEGNRDGDDHEISWNNGQEGPTEDKTIAGTRKRQAKNLLATLLLSQGVPMLLAGDERLRGQGGNNNAYCQDNETNWLDWSESPDGRELMDFTRTLIALRREHAVFRRRKFLNGEPLSDGEKDLAWLKSDGTEVKPDEWRNLGTQTLGMLYSGRGAGEGAPHGAMSADDSFLVILNGSPDTVAFAVPTRGSGWEVVIDTSGRGARDILGGSDLEAKAAERSMLVLRMLP